MLIRSFYDDKEDRELGKLGELLEELAMVPDVREVLRFRSQSLMEDVSAETSFKRV